MKAMKEVKSEQKDLAELVDRLRQELSKQRQEKDELR
jgi:hypothetical protein